VVIDAAGEVNVVFAPASDDDKNSLVYSQDRRMIQSLRGAEPFGLPELLLLASPQPLNDTLRKLRQVVATINGVIDTGNETICANQTTSGIQNSFHSRLKQHPIDNSKQILNAEQTDSELASTATVDAVMTDMFSVLDNSRGDPSALDLPDRPRAVDVEQVAVISRLFHVVPAEAAANS
ncbi:MAG: hypothetical protein F6K42_05270, partial [Leptolyngbya sp. SIO1D8]|nr:hypothetical protein [Leptolyngbya sp. SIO1D8]